MSTTTLTETRRPPAAPLTAQWTAPQPIVSRDRTPSPAVPHGARPTAGHQAVLALPAEVRWVPVARRSVAAVLAQWRFPSTGRESAELVVGELAANAAEHGRHDMTVRLALHAGVLRISVTDSGAPAQRPRPAQEADPEEHGRGLAIVELLSVDIRVRQGLPGRRVDVTLHATATES